MQGIEAIGASANIPLSPAQVTPDWLGSVLQRDFPGIAVLSVKAGDFLGFKPNKVRLEVVYGAGSAALNAPTSMILKGGFRDAKGEHAFSELDLGLILELAGYAEVVPHIDVVTPHCYWVGMDEASGAGAVLLPDLAPEGALFLKEQWSLSREEMLKFLDAQAKIHAPWLDGHAFRPGGLFGPESGLRRRGDDLFESYISKLTTPAYWDKFSALPRATALPRAFRDAEIITKAADRMYREIAASAETVLHGDEHIGNLYLDGDGQAGFIDWCCRIAPWIIGFSYFVLVTLDPLDRRAWERDLLRYYLASLQRQGAAVPSFDEAWHLHKCAALFPFIIWYNNSGKWQPEAINTRNTMRAALAMLDHDTLGILGAMPA